MSNFDIFNVNTFDVDRLRFSAVKEKDGRKTVFINYEKENGEMTPVYLQTPKMWAPFGPSAPSDKYPTSFPKWNLTMSFKNDGTNEELAKFEKLLNDIDTRIKEHGKEMASTYFPGIKPEKLDDMFELNFTSLVKPPKEGTNYPASLAPKVPVNDGKFNISVYDSSRNEMQFDKIPKGSTVIGILQIKSLYFAGKGAWGVTLGLPQLLVFPSKKLQGCQIQVDESDLTSKDETGSGEFDFEDQ